ncbi:hypothetical protein AGMMS49992_19970 [Clostridia bacterium]|nr:hypothetical protein AGMMS49992_19970 [Clostridia bacterium]
MERNYEFRRRLREVHKPGMRDDAVWRSEQDSFRGCVIREDWEIVFPSGSGKVMENAAYDLLDYFRVSQGMYLRVRGSRDINEDVSNPGGKIVLTTAALSPDLAPSGEERAAHRIVADKGIVICGRDDRGAAQGCYYLEDRMNIHLGPVVERGEFDRAPLFTPRMIHSGYGLDMFPDEHIRAIAHAGMDALLVFVKGIDETPHGYVDFNDLIERASNYGVDVYAYSYMISKKHPDDPDAREFYENSYGKLFERCPGFKGVILVGESCEFPSKDPRVTPHMHYEDVSNPGGKIVLTTAALSPDLAPSGEERAAHRIVADKGIVICGRDDRGAAQGCYYLEDRMNIHLGPVVERGEFDRAPLFTPRMIHSGYGLDMFPDEHIRAIAHAGMDALLVFVKGIDETPHGYVDFNDLIERASNYGVDVYAYSYMISKKHPDDPDAREFYENSYGKLFERCPGFKGVILVGESCEFPSKDPRVTPHMHYEVTPENNPNKLPSPGWFPCYDYPQWLNMVKDVVRSKKPDADIVFWTYNWGWANQEDRLALIRALPTDITLQATWEMFQGFEYPGGVNERTTDYTLFFEGPGQYFSSEAEEAKKRGIRLYAMANTGGLSWDIGVIPYEPCPQQWMRRHAGILKARDEWGLAGIMESHHYGYWPSFIGELVKAAYWSPKVDGAKTLKELATRDFTADYADSVIHVWELYSEGIRNCVSTNEDQYGPFRIGPAYPLLFLEEAEIPSVPYAHFGNNKICNPMYSFKPELRNRLLFETERIDEMRKLFAEGNALLAPIVDKLEGRRRNDAEHQLALGRFIERSATTVVNVKRWFRLKQDLLSGEGDATAMIAEMKSIGKAELENARETIPLVNYDSRLGFEPSMEYMCDEAHIKWKIEHTEKALAALDVWVKEMNTCG